LSNLRNTSRRIEAWIVNQIGDFVCGHFYGREWLVELMQLIRVVHVDAQPEIKDIGVEDHRHAVVDRFDKFVGRGCQNGEGLDHASVCRFP